MGRCIRQGNLPQPDDVHCPSTQRHIVNAWQQCAELCNDQPECHTFTVKTQALLGHRDFHCYFHNWYECKKENKKSVGIDNYVHHEDIRDDKYDNLGVWSGICRMHAVKLQSHVETVLIHSLAAATVVRLILAVPAAAMEKFKYLVLL